MQKIASFKNIEIFAKENSKFSFFKSPYISHKLFSAVDIYSEKPFSPVSGKVIDIKEFDAPSVFKNKNYKEYLTVIENKNFVIKILHVQPILQIGEKVKCGEILGNFIRNGYYTFWNDFPIHVDVREKNDYIRAKNFHPLKNEIGKIEKNCFEKNKNCYELSGKVVFSSERYSLVETEFANYKNFYGISFENFFIDGSNVLGYFALIGEGNKEIAKNCSAKYENCYLFENEKNQIKNFNKDKDIKIFDRNNTSANSFYKKKKFEIFRHSKISINVFAKGKKLKIGGVAFSLFLRKPLIKIIPLHYGKNKLKEEQQIRMELKI